MLDSNRIKFVIMKTIRYIMGFFLFFALTSCNDWFEVSPETQVSSDDLYEKGNGFRMQVNGLYKSLGSSSLYAQELTWGFLDVLGQYYVRQNLDNAYQEVNDRQYENANVLSIIDGIWSGMYKVIADCNNIIEHVDKASNSIFELGEPERLKIRGEALAVRAFVHFDLLRLFAPAPTVNENGSWIPYVTSSESVINNKLTVKQVLENVVRDLLEAHTCMVPWDSAIVYSDYYNEEVIRMWHIMERFWTDWNTESEIAEFFGHQRSRLNIFLGDGLGYQKSVGFQLDSFGNKLFIGHLTSQVVSLDHVVTFQSVVSGKSFHVHDGVDTHGVSVGSGTCTYNNQRTSDIFTDELVSFVHIPFRSFYFRNMNTREIHGVRAASVTVEEGVALGQLFVEYYLRVFKTHFFQ